MVATRSATAATAAKVATATAATTIATLGGQVWLGHPLLFEDLNDLVAQSHSNNLGRSSKVRTTFPK